MMNFMNETETKKSNGGAVYRCKHCGYTNTSYAKVYANALACVTKKYGYSVLKIVSSII